MSNEDLQNRAEMSRTEDTIQHGAGDGVALSTVSYHLALFPKPHSVLWKLQRETGEAGCNG